jgi:eukaryotic-like serine/threonine-protein kinase
MNEATVFAAALEKVTDEERAAFVADACGGDERLRRRVEALLRAHAESDEMLDPPSGSERTGAYPIREAPGAVIGPYKLLEQIGEGGFGVVFMAEQTQPVRRKVALKILKPGMDTTQVVARFEAERQALAIMDHPNIARVFDGGATPSGRPFFVMELVKGVPITEFCDQNHLTPRQRLELFLPVCQAVQHAHHKGIIHRDLKPSNVLVSRHDSTPVPKIIDFGVAKALGQELTDKTLFTGIAQMIGTPLYMSPEQAGMSDLDVDTRSDIYSLGVLLYELLTGTTPFDRERFKRAAYDEIRRMIKEEEPPKPSTRLSDSGEALASISANRHTEPAKLSKLVKGELDWIVMKALEKDRARRYETANGFMADVQRYLADEPVQACPPSAGYRLRKFARRNKGALAMASVLGVAVVLVVASIGWTVRDRSAREEDAARDQAARQAKVEGQVELILDEVERLQQEQKWPEALAAAQRADAALAGGEADPATQERVSRVLADLELVLRLEQIRAEGSSVWDDAHRLIPTRANQEYAAAFRFAGLDLDTLTTREAAERIAVRKAVAVALIAAVDDWAFVRNVLNDRAGTHHLTDVARAADPDSWRQLVREALERQDLTVLKQLAASDELERQPAASLFLLGVALHRKKQPEGLEVLRRAQRQYPSDFWINYRLGVWLIWKGHPQTEEGIGYMRAAVALRPLSDLAIMNLGNGFLRLGRHDEAITCYRKAIKLNPKGAGAHANLGIALQVQGKLNDAIAAWRKAIELYPKGASAYFGLGNALRVHGKLGDAIAAYQKAIELDPKDAKARNHLGIALRKQEKLDEAITAYRKAIELDPKYPDAQIGLGNVLGEQGKLDEAIVCYRKAIELDPKYAEAHIGLGNVLGKQGKLDDAIVCYRRAIELDPKSALAHFNVGTAKGGQKKLNEAISWYRKAIALNPNYRDAYYNLGRALWDQSELDEAIACYQKAIELDPKNASGHTNLGAALVMQGKLDEAIACYQKAIELDPKNASRHTNLGAALAMQGKLDEAVICLRKAIELDRKNASRQSNLGVALRDLGLKLANQKKLNEAITCWQEAVKLRRTDFTTHRYLAQALTEVGKLDEGISASQKAVELKPNDAGANNQLAWLLATCPDLKLRDPKEAVVRARKAVELDPKNALYPSTLGAAYYRSGDWKAAITALEKSMEFRKGGDGNEWFFLAMAHWRLGEKNKARAWYERATQWMDKNQPDNEELRRFRTEAAALLKTADGPKSKSESK